MRAVPDRNNLYSETAAGRLAPAGRGRAAARLRAEPGRQLGVGDRSRDLKVIETFKVVSSAARRAVVDLRTLWVANNAEAAPTAA
jgi:hypothetical protein